MSTAASDLETVRQGLEAAGIRIERRFVQRESGRWYTRSLNNDKAHYITHAGTAFSVLALSEAGEKVGK